MWGRMYEIKDIALELLGEPNKRLSSNNELRFGSFGSMSIDLDKNTFFDHEANEGGGVVDLLKRFDKDPKDYLPPMEKKGIGKLVARYPYLNENGEEVYEVCRFEPKTFRPRHKNGSGYIYGLSGITPLPYRLQDIIKNPSEPICIVEGEKDADLLAEHGLIATCNSGGAGNWNKSLNEYFRKRNVIIIPDNDAAGEKHAQIVIGNLQGVASAIKLVKLPVSEKEDVADFLDKNNISALKEIMKSTGILKTKIKPVSLFSSWEVVNPLSIEPRDFIYSNHYIRKFASTTVSQGGVGKSTLVLTECIAMCTGHNLLGVEPKSTSKVIYFNAEDPKDEIERRVLSICSHFQIPQEELVGQLFIASGRDEDIVLAEGNDGVINEAAFEKIEQFCLDHSIDVFAADPLANMTSSPETNEVFKMLGKRISQLADKCNCSVEVVHHTRKLNGRVAEVEDARGGSSLVASVRAARSLNAMSPDEALKAGLDTHINHFRIESGGKNNLSKPLEKAMWFEKEAIQLDNGDWVAVIKQWEFPDAFSGITKTDTRKVQLAVDDTETPYKFHHASSNWVGKLVAEVLGLNTNDKADKSRINTIIKTWVSTDVLTVDEEHDGRNGRVVKVVRAGSNNVAVEK